MPSGELFHLYQYKLTYIMRRSWYTSRRHVKLVVKSSFLRWIFTNAFPHPTTLTNFSFKYHLISNCINRNHLFDNSSLSYEVKPTQTKPRQCWRQPHPPFCPRPLPLAPGGTVDSESLIGLLDCVNQSDKFYLYS